MCNPRFCRKKVTQKTRNFANFRMKIFHYGLVFGIFETTLSLLTQFESAGHDPEVRLLIGAFVRPESTWLHVGPTK